MTHQKCRLIITFSIHCLLTLLILSACLPGCSKRGGQAQLIPVVEGVIGTAMLERDERPGVALKPGMVLREGDVIRIGDESKVKFSAGEDNRIHALGKCSFKVARMAVDTAGARSLDLLMTVGEIFSVINKLTGESSLSVATPTAVASIRGTTFAIRHSATLGSTFLVLSGKVAVTHRESGAMAVVSPRQKINLAQPDAELVIESVTEVDIKELEKRVGEELFYSPQNAQNGVAPALENLPNSAPVWYRAPRGIAYQNMQFCDTVRAEDPENRVVTYELERGPQGMVLDFRTGAIKFLPRVVGNFPVALSAVDERGARTPLEYTIVVMGGLQAIIDIPHKVPANKPFAIDGGRSMSRSGSTRGLQYRFDLDDDGSWDYPADGNFGPESRVEHVIERAGNFRICLEIQNQEGQTARSAATIGIEAQNSAPVARIQVLPSVGIVNQVVSFDASLSVDTHDPVESLSVRWDLDGDGGWDYPQDGAFTKDKIIYNMWDRPGAYRVCVQVRDLIGGVGQGCADIVVYEGVTLDSLVAPDTVRVGEQFSVVASARSLQAGVASYSWNLDADSAWDTLTTVPTLETRYSRPGRHKIGCQVRDSLGLTDSKNVFVVAVTEELFVAAGGPYSTRSAKPLWFTGIVQDSAGGIAGYAWDFDGDGQVDWQGVSNDSCSFSYSEPGLYSAVFWIKTKSGRIVADTAVVMVHSSSPKALAGSDIVLKRPRAVELCARGTDADNDIVKYEWDYNGDGEFEWSSADSGCAEHVFEAYAHAVLRVTDREGAQDLDTVVVVLCPDDMALVEGGGYCIDRYEYPNRKGIAPKVQVTRDQARQLCVQEGKSLCSAKQWTTACHSADSGHYPYGNKYVPDNCNLVGNAIVHNSIARAGYFENCRTADAIFDMSGNAAEWTLDSEGAVYGGSYQHAAADGACESHMRLSQSRGYFYVGFRCCK